MGHKGANLLAPRRSALVPARLSLRHDPSLVKDAWPPAAPGNEFFTSTFRKSSRRYQPRAEGAISGLELRALLCAEVDRELLAEGRVLDRERCSGDKDSTGEIEQS